MPLPNKAGTLPLGADYRPIQVGGSIRCSDLNGINGPFYLSTAPFEIVPPGNGVQVLVVCDGAWRVGDNNQMSQDASQPNTPGTGWFPLQAGQYLPIGCGSGIQGQKNSYIRAETGTVRCWMLFVMID